MGLLGGTCYAAGESNLFTQESSMLAMQPDNELEDGPGPGAYDVLSAIHHDSRLGIVTGIASLPGQPGGNPHKR